MVAALWCLQNKRKAEPVPERRLLAIYLHDHPDDIRIGATLAEYGYDVLDLTNPEIALLALRENLVDLIVVNIQGEMSTIPLIRIKDSKPDVPVISIVTPLVSTSQYLAGSDRVMLQQDVPTHLIDALNSLADTQSLVFRRWFNEWRRRTSQVNFAGNKGLALPRLQRDLDRRY